MPDVVYQSCRVCRMMFRANESGVIPWHGGQWSFDTCPGAFRAPAGVDEAGRNRLAEALRRACWLEDDG